MPIRLKLPLTPALALPQNSFCSLPGSRLMGKVMMAMSKSKLSSRFLKTLTSRLRKVALMPIFSRFFRNGSITRVNELPLAELLRISKLSGRPVLRLVILPSTKSYPASFSSATACRRFSLADR